MKPVGTVLICERCLMDYGCNGTSITYCKICSHPEICPKRGSYNAQKRGVCPVCEKGGKR